MRKNLMMAAMMLLGMTGAVAGPIEIKNVDNGPLGRCGEWHPSITEEELAGFTELKAPANEPQGEDKFYSMSIAGLEKTWTGPKVSSGSFPAHIYFDGNTVYIGNPVPTANTKCFLKGTKADNMIVVKMPQKLGTLIDGETGKPFDVYANIMQLTVGTSSTGGRTAWYENCESGKTLFYVINDDGTIEMSIPGNGIDKEVNLPLFMLGLAYNTLVGNDRSWSGYADAAEVYNPNFNEEITTLPEGVKADQWSMLSGSTTRLVNLAFDGDDVYLGNLIDDLPDSYVKGTLSNGVVNFPITYLGVSDTYGRFAWFTPTEADAEWDAAYEEYVDIDVVTEGFKMNYDAQAKKLRYAVNYSRMYITDEPTVNEKVIKYLKYYDQPILTWQDPELLNALPQDPVFIEASDYRQFFGCEFVTFDLPIYNMKYMYMDPKRLSYDIYIDGNLHTFNPKAGSGYTEPITRVPYLLNTSGYGIYGGTETQHEIALYLDNWETIGCQLHFQGYDGEIYSSPLVTETRDFLYRFDPDYNAVETMAMPEKVEYTNLSGVRCVAPEKGLYLKTTHYSDGSRKVEKVVLK